MGKLLKFLHTLAAIVMIGALAAHITLLTLMPEPGSLVEYATLRQGIGAIARYLLLPSLALVLISGLLAMAFSGSYYKMGWAWAKLGLGVVSFEGTLLTVQGPALQAAEASLRALEGSLDTRDIEAMVRGEWASLWVILGIALINVMLAIWRPRFSRAPGTGTGQ
jgi:uncharacterized membrane protein